MQNKMHWAAHGHTAAEIVHERADAEKPFMGMQTTRPGGVVRKSSTREEGAWEGMSLVRQPEHRLPAHHTQVAPHG